MPSYPLVSVIIPVYRGEATLPSVLAALAPQVLGDAEVEVIVVESSGLEAAAELQSAYDWLKVIGLPERTLPGRARNLGVEQAHGQQLVFLDADAVPALDWLAQLRRGATGSVLGVAGAVANGTPGDAVGTAGYLLEFSEFMPTRRGRPRHAASCNMLAERRAFDSAGGFVEDLWPGEDTVLTVPWASSGRLAFAATAIVWHVNRTGHDDMLHHQYRLGRSFAHVCDRVEFPHAQFSRWPLLPVSPVFRLAALVARLHGQPRGLRPLLRSGPTLVSGLTAWCRGLSAERRALAP